MEELIKIIRKNKLGKLLESVSLKIFNTYKLSPQARVIYYTKDIPSLIYVLTYLKEHNLKYIILGKGSNVIFNFDYYDGMIIKLDYLNSLEINGTTVTVGSGYSLPKLAMHTAKLGLSGLEFAQGIPGTVGGSIYMNAGAYKKDMGYIVTKIKVLTPDLKVKTMYNKDLNFHYRSSFLKEHKDYICLEATLKLARQDKEEILNLIKTRRAKRLESQPLEYPSAGSVFRNPENNYAGKLIEDLNLKGYNINGAEISTKHANFIINKNKCSGKDIVSLINLIKDKVYEEYKINLVLEQEIIE